MLLYILRHRIAILILGIVVTLFLGFNLKYLSIDGSFSTVLPDNDSDFLFNRYVEETFGSSDELIIFIKDKNGIYSPDSVRLIEQISRELAEIDEVDKSRIFSIISAADNDV
ncbi:MAG: hypothetical protein PF518_17490 [Spirochaetaceae bacterium]|jgi:predicted RND superfamily exporter protein|nr:hypothetical protein [Spirochaetaceae bacterium]